MFAKKAPVLFITTIAVAIATLATVALAGNVHLKGGKNAKPKYTDNGLTLTATAALAGLGNEDIVVKVQAEGLATSICINPSGANQPPGQNPAPVTLAGTTSIPKEEIKNGSVTFTVTTEGPTSPIPGSPGCPNKNWIQEITGVDFSSAKITVEQPAGTVVLVVDNTL